MKYLILVLCTFVSLVLNAQEKIDVFFDFNESIPNATSQRALQNWISNNPKVEIYQMGSFCDSVGTNLYNKKLAEKRIKAIEKILKSNKITFSKEMKKDVYGEDFESSANQNENRRVTIFYKEKVDEKSYAVDLSSAEVGQYLALKGLNFYGGREVVLMESLPILEELLKVMIENESLCIEIHGHICCNPKDYENLSTRRAETVYDYLIENGVSQKRMSFKGYGSTMPIFPLSENNEDERIANRRVEIFIIQK